MTEESADGTEAVPDIRAMVDELDLETVYFLEISGKRWISSEMDSHKTNLISKYRRSENQVDYLFEARCEPTDNGGDAIADLQVSVVAAYVTEQDVEQYSPDMVMEFGNHVALYAAYPYLRQEMQDLAARLGVPALTLGLLKRGAPPPFHQSSSAESS